MDTRVGNCSSLNSKRFDLSNAFFDKGSESGMPKAWFWAPTDENAENVTFHSECLEWRVYRGTQCGLPYLRMDFHCKWNISALNAK